MILQALDIILGCFWTTSFGILEVNMFKISPVWWQIESEGASGVKTQTKSTSGTCSTGATLKHRDRFKAFSKHNNFH